MTRITLDQLPDPSQAFTVCDEAGNIVGWYVPASRGPLIGRDEIERRKKQKDKSFSTAEVLAHLEKL